MRFRQIKTDISVEGAIVKAIAFFDLFAYPLTGFEIWKYVGVKCELAEVLEVIQRSLAPLEGAKLLEEKNGFYFLAGREEIIKERMARYNYTDKKFKRAVWLARIFKFIPWIKMIAVGNIIGAHNLKKESDIDLFIITEKRRVWLTRFFCVLIIKILGLRPQPGNLRDKICLSCYVSETAMNLEKLMLPAIQLESQIGGSDSSRLLEDVNFIYWLAGFVPIYNVGDTYKRFTGANDWIKKYLPNWQVSSFFLRHDAGRGFSDFYHDVVDLLIGGLEVNVKNFQLKLMPPEMKSLMNQDTRVVISDDILKLHVNDRREEYRQLFIDRIQDLKIKML